MAHKRATMDSRQKAESLTRKKPNTDRRKAANVAKNDAQRNANQEFASQNILHPSPGHSNGGHGSPTRPSQVKRAVARIGKPAQIDEKTGKTKF